MHRLEAELVEAQAEAQRWAQAHTTLTEERNLALHELRAVLETLDAIEGESPSREQHLEALEARMNELRMAPMPRLHVQGAGQGLVGEGLQPGGGEAEAAGGVAVDGEKLEEEVCELRGQVMRAQQALRSETQRAEQAPQGAVA